MPLILSIFARHLAYLKPVEPLYNIAAASHLEYNLSMFRRDINQEFTTSNFDFFMTTALLVYFEIWTEPDFVVEDSAGLITLDLSKDRSFHLAHSLTEVILSSGPVMYEKPSSFHVHIMDSLCRVLTSATQLNKETLASFEDFLSYSRRLRYEQLSVASGLEARSGQGPCEWVAGETSEEVLHSPVAHQDVVSRLAALLPFLPELPGPEFPEVTERLMPDLTRYLLSFWPKIHSYAEKTITRRDPKGLLLLYRFSSAVRILLGIINC